jgi:hypothetical protein
MTYNHFNPNQKANKRAIAWALFSQSIWLPVFFTDSHDQIASSRSDYDFSGVATNIPHQNLPSDISLPSSIANKSYGLIAHAQKSSGILLNTVLPKDTAIQSKLDVPSSFRPLNTSPIVFNISPRPSAIPPTSPFRLTPPDSRFFHTSRTIHFRGANLLERLYTRSDLLGGSLTLADLNEPLIPPFARAERAQVTRMGDPLSSVPTNLREPMRNALKSLTENLRTNSKLSTGKASGNIGLEQARVIHIPSARIKHFSEVPLALQSDGTVDILNNPNDPDVVEEIKSWSSKQQLPDKGRMAPAVVHLHPLPQEIQAPGPMSTSQSMPDLVLDKSSAAPTPQVTPPVVQEASLPEPATATPIVPPPPPPVNDSRTSSLPSIDSPAPVATVQASVSSIPQSTGDVQ